jgi:hypothetical protein
MLANEKQGRDFLLVSTLVASRVQKADTYKRAREQVGLFNSLLLRLHHALS